MTRLEDLKPGASVKGILPDGLVTILSVKWHGSVLEVTYKDALGRPGNELVYRDREPTLEIASAGTPWSFDADGALTWPLRYWLCLYLLAWAGCLNAEAGCSKQ